jgi:hypothetical protein
MEIGESPWLSALRRLLRSVVTRWGRNECSRNGSRRRLRQRVSEQGLAGSTGIENQYAERMDAEFLNTFLKDTDKSTDKSRSLLICYAMETLYPRESGWRGEIARGLPILWPISVKGKLL